MPWAVPRQREADVVPDGDGTACGSDELEHALVRCELPEQAEQDPFGWDPELLPSRLPCRRSIGDPNTVEDDVEPRPDPLLT